MVMRLPVIAMEKRKKVRVVLEPARRSDSNLFVYRLTDAERQRLKVARENPGLIVVIP